MLLNLHSVCAGEDELATGYMKSAIRMAETLHLVGNDRHALSDFEVMSAEELSMHSYVAWSTFNLST